MKYFVKLHFIGIISIYKYTAKMKLEMHEEVGRMLKMNIKCTMETGNVYQETMNNRRIMRGVC